MTFTLPLLERGKGIFIGCWSGWITTYERRRCGGGGKLIKIKRWIYIKIPLNPPLQKGEASGVPGFIEMLPFSLQTSRVNGSDLQEFYNLSYEPLQGRNLFLIKRAT
jgi:hypothetical protein